MMEPKAPGAHCDSCPLQKERMAKGIRVGTGDGTVVLIGEAPGIQEAIKGIPFVGPSGELLHRTLDSLGATNLWITNACLCRPPSNVIDDVSVGCCHDRLMDEIRQQKPSLIITLGATPLHTLFPSAGNITTVRGNFMFQTELGVNVLPTYHPAYILRQPSKFTDFAQDMQRALRPPNFNLSDPIGPKEVTIVRTLTEAIFALDALAEQGEIVCDIETSGFDRLRDHILCMVFTWKHAQALVIPGSLLQTSAVKTMLRSLFSRPNITWIGHGMKFDVEFIQVLLGMRPIIGFDTLMAHYVNDERTGTHDLKEIARLNFNAPDWEGDIKNYLPHPKTDSYTLIPEEVLLKYAAYDGDYTFRLYRLLSEELKRKPGLRGLHDNVLVPASNALADIELMGIRFDPAIQEEVAEELSSELFLTGVALSKTAEDPMFNPNSPQQVGAVLFDKLHLPQISGRSTAVAVLEALKDRHPFVDDMMKYRDVAKLMSTYVTGLPETLGPDGRIHTSYMIHGTVTGRLSSRDPNLQNIPRGSTIRNMFIPSDGMVMVEADYSQAELRALAWYSQDPFLVGVYQAGRDIHTEVAKQMFGPDFTKEQRVAAKMVVFGLVYGRTAFALAQDMRIPKLSPQEAVRYINEFFKRMPKAVEWMNGIKNRARTTGMLETPIGRQRRFDLVVQGNVSEVERQSVNFMCQSLASDLTLLSLVRVHNAFMKGWAPQVRPHILLTVHDCLVVECYPQDFEEVSKLLRKTMTSVPLQILGESVPFKVSLATGARWGSLKEVEE